MVARLGPPLEQELAEWVPADQIDPLADRYRELYAELGLVGLIALPGAHAALDAVRAASGQTLVVTAKFEPNAWLCLEHVDLAVDDVVGWRHGPQKGETLLERGASVYVGDTPPDMDAAHLAGAIGRRRPHRAVHRRPSSPPRARTSSSARSTSSPTGSGARSASS